MRARGVVAIALCASGCSALGLDRFPIFECESDQACDLLNADRGIAPDACARWQCEEASGACVFRQRRDDDDDGAASIACGGADCDDADTQTAPGRALSVARIAESDAEPEWASWGSDAAWPSLAFGRGAEAAFGVPGVLAVTRAAQATDAALDNPSDPSIELRCASAAHESASCLSPPPPESIGIDTCQTHEDCQDADFCNGFERCAPNEMGIDARGCRPDRAHCEGAGQRCDGELGACLVVRSEACRLGGLAAAPLGLERHLAAAIATDGCDAGTLRIGWMSAGEPDLARGVPGPNVLSRGGEARTPGYYGVDVVGAESTGIEVTCGEGGGLVLGPDAACTGRSRDEGAPRGVSSLRVATLEAAPGEGRLRPQGLVAWLAAPRCRETGGCSAGTPASVELLGAWEEHALGRDGVDLAWTSISDDGVPRALAPRALGRRAPAIAAVRGAGYVVAYPAEGGGASAVFVEALEDPPEVERTPPYLTSLAPMSRTTLPLVIRAGQSLAGADIAEIDVAAGIASGGTATLGIAWIEGGAPFFAVASLSTIDGTITRLDPIPLGEGPASAPSIVFSDAACGAGCAGFGIAFERGSAVWLARASEAGVLQGGVTRAGGEGARMSRVMVGASGALRAGWYEPSQQAFVRSSGLCPGE